MSNQIQVGIIVYDDVDLLDVTGPKEVFAAASEPIETETNDPILKLYENESLFDVDLISIYEQTIVHSVDGFQFRTDKFYNEIEIDDYTAIVIPGGKGVHTIKRDQEIVEWVKNIIISSPHLLSVCTGVYICAETGELNGKQVTTHHRHYDLFMEAYPEITLVRDVRFVETDNIIFTGGVTAGIDGAINLVEKLLGPRTASQVKLSLNL